MAVDLQSSRTALLSAAARAAHLTVDDEPFLFRDTVAERVLGSTGVEMIRYHRQRGGHPIPANTRVTATVRSRFAETALREAVDRGVDQYLLVGAGLDTFGARARSSLAVSSSSRSTIRVRNDGSGSAFRNPVWMFPAPCVMPNST